MSCGSDRMNFLVSNDPAAVQSPISMQDRTSRETKLDAPTSSNGSLPGSMNGTSHKLRFLRSNLCVCRGGNLYAESRFRSCTRFTYVVVPCLSPSSFDKREEFLVLCQLYTRGCTRVIVIAPSPPKTHSEVPVNTETTNIPCVRKKEKDCDCNRQ